MTVLIRTKTFFMLWVYLDYYVIETVLLDHLPKKEALIIALKLLNKGDEN